MKFTLAQRVLGAAIAVGILCLHSSLLSAQVIQVCGQPNAYGTALIPEKNRLGEFLVELKPPDYGDRNSVRQHLVYSRIWSRILSSNLRSKTHGTCDAVLDASIFPNLWTYLIVGTPRDAISDRSRCLSVLQDALSRVESDDATTKKAASDELSVIQRWGQSRGDYIIEADNILKKSMQSIFSPGTVMEALASVGTTEFREVDNSSFEQWLQKQRAFAKIRPLDFSNCLGDSGALSNHTLDNDIRPPPSSSPIEPGVMNVNIDPQVMGPILRSVVIIGLKTPPSFLPGAAAVVEANVLTKYCNRERPFFDNSIGSNITVTVRCLRVVELTKPWVVLFCDPKNCSAKQQAEAVATVIARDPEILAFVQANSENLRPIGPYLVNVE